MSGPLWDQFRLHKEGELKQTKFTEDLIKEYERLGKAKEKQEKDHADAIAEERKNNAFAISQLTIKVYKERYETPLLEKLHDKVDELDKKLKETKLLVEAADAESKKSLRETRSLVVAADAESKKSLEYLRPKVQNIEGSVRDTENMVKEHISTGAELENLRDLQQGVENNAFVSVLIDGNVVKFKDDFARSSRGTEAARKLTDTVESYLRTKEIDTRDMDIVVFVYVDFWALASLYPRLTGSYAQGWIRGFNASQPLCNMMDSDTREGAGVKLSALFALHVGDVCCKHIIFGGNFDEKCIKALEDDAQDHSNPRRSRVTLLEERPLRPISPSLRNMYESTSFSSVFQRSTT